jgi:hypothetical protein
MLVIMSNMKPFQNVKRHLLSLLYRFPCWLCNNTKSFETKHFTASVVLQQEQNSVSVIFFAIIN